MSTATVQVLYTVSFTVARYALYALPVGGCRILLYRPAQERVPLVLLVCTPVRTTYYYYCTVLLRSSTSTPTPYSLLYVLVPFIHQRAPAVLLLLLFCYYIVATTPTPAWWVVRAIATRYALRSAHQWYCAHT